MKAYIITSPGLNDEHALEHGIHTMAATTVMAWRRHIGAETDIGKAWEEREISRRIMHWFDRGYRVRECEVKILPKVGD